MIQVHMLVCENSWIIEMHGATIKVLGLNQIHFKMHSPSKGWLSFAAIALLGLQEFF
jgi:hypothetical protein